MIFAVSSGTASPGAETTRAARRSATAQLGALSLAHDPTVWHIAAKPGRLEATCIGRDCGDASLAGSLTAEPPSHCNEAALAGAAGAQPRVTVYRLPRLVLYLVAIDLGCRNLVPRRLEACTTWAGHVYRFVSGPRSCRTGPSPGAEPAAIDLLQGLSVR